MSLKERFVDFIADGPWIAALGLFFGYARNWLPGFVVLFWLEVGSGFAHATYPETPLPFAGDVLLLFLKIAFFCVTFFNQEPLRDRMPTGPKPLVFAALGYLGVVAVASVLILPVVVGDFGNPFVNSVMVAIWSLVALFLLLRVSFTVPLAFNGIRDPVGISWRMTHGKTWSFACNAFMLNALVGAYYRLNEFWSGWASPFIEALLNVVYSGVMCALLSVTCRMYYGEYIARGLAFDRRRLERDLEG